MSEFLFPDLEIIQSSLKKYHLPLSLEKEIRDFLSCKRSENVLICCHSDCEVCNQTIYECLQEIKQKLRSL